MLVLFIIIIIIIIIPYLHATFLFPSSPPNPTHAAWFTGSLQFNQSKQAKVPGQMDMAYSTPVVYSI